MLSRKRAYSHEPSQFISMKRFQVQDIISKSWEQTSRKDSLSAGKRETQIFSPLSPTTMELITTKKKGGMQLSICQATPLQTVDA